MIIFSDFDGTLYLKADPAQTAASLAAIREWVVSGHQFCITTGRSYKSVSTKMPELLDLCDFFIVDSGSIVMDKRHQQIHAFYFPSSLVTALAEFSKTLPEAPIIFYYTPDYEGVAPQTENVTKLRFWLKDETLLSPVTEQISQNFPVQAFRQPASSRYPEISADYHGFVEIIPENSGKSKAIEYLATKNNISNTDIIPIGDGLNDAGMVRDFAGYAIAGSPLSAQFPAFKTTPSLAALISSRL